MSPGPTFDRVYLALKEQLTGGRFAPGEHLEPTALGEELAASITPVRDALHRLVGERIVEAPRNDGFRVPIVTELLLRQLYGWQADLVRLSMAHQKPDPDGKVQSWLSLGDSTSLHAADLFMELARTSGNWELVTALANACDRLGPATLLEGRFISDLEDELEKLRTFVSTGDLAALRSAVTAYGRRRERVVPQLVDAFQRAF
ncbi:MAG TPA: GntR family transcriptional regulator [Allosphingosinicella sp.]|nr:GntR family transcriptional regulator [Allosphingosinicella sp.]